MEDLGRDAKRKVDFLLCGIGLRRIKSRLDIGRGNIVHGGSHDSKTGGNLDGSFN